MPPITTPDLHQKSFRIKHDDNRFITKLLAKENPDSNSSSSFRVYYKDFSGAVPFTWETRPGTPKHRFHHNPDIPPLTPPPSYYSTNTINHSDPRSTASKSKVFLHALLRKLTRRKSESPSRSAFSRSFREPEVWVKRERRRFASWGGDERAEAGRKEKVVLNGYSSVGIMKRAFLSIVGHRSA